MKILFTGSSSFTGYWFIKALIEAGHEVVATFAGEELAYTSIRKQRVELVKGLCRTEFNASFGSDRFTAVLDAEPHWDLLCHHAADVTDYKSLDFDVLTAVARNTHHARQVLRGLKNKGCSRLIVTGSVFEQGEGVGSEPMRAFSPYGLSKGISGEMFRYHALETEMHLGKFVIPNPFGPYEEPRFTAYLVKNWKDGKTPQVSTPAYVRDNIHVSLLASAYARFAGNRPDTPGFTKMNPSGYVETQGAFAKRFSEEMQNRLAIVCNLTVANQQEFPEPQVRINTEPVSHLFPNWNETLAWNEIAAYYQSIAN
jgi:UDP-glucose 4-epimerase